MVVTYETKVVRSLTIEETEALVAAEGLNGFELKALSHDGHFAYLQKRIETPEA